MYYSQDYRGQKRSIGSSYLIFQSCGPGRVGGLEIILQRPQPGLEPIRILNTSCDLTEIQDDISPFTAEAVRGIVEYARLHDVDLSKWQITINRFLIHDVDSPPFLYCDAAKNALHAALSTWHLPVR